MSGAKTGRSSRRSGRTGRTGRTVRAPKKPQAPTRGKPSAKRSPKRKATSTLLTHPDADKARVLAAFTRKGNVTGACRAAGVARRTWYDWMESDEVFAQRAVEAREEVVDELAEEAVARAKDGSDTLLIFLLKSYRRSEYGDRQVVTVVSPQIRERLARQAEILAEELDAESAERIFARLAEVWR